MASQKLVHRLNIVISFCGPYSARRHRLERVDGLDGDAEGRGEGAGVLALKLRERAHLHDAGAEQQGHSHEEDDGNLPSDNVRNDNGGQKIDHDGEHGADNGTAEAAHGGRVGRDDGQQRRGRAAAGLVPVHVLLVQRAEREHTDSVEELLGNVAKAGPARRVGEQLDDGQHEEEATKEATRPEDVVGRVARIDVANGVAENETGSGKGESDENTSKNGNQEPEKVGPDELEHAVEDCASRLVGIQLILWGSSLFAFRCSLTVGVGHEIMHLDRFIVLGNGVALPHVGFNVAAVSACKRDAVVLLLRLDILKTNHAGIVSIESHELTVCALLENDTAAHDNNVIGILDGGQPVGNGNEGAVLGDGLDGHLDASLTCRVERRGGLVENQDFGVADQSTCKSNSLSLSAADKLAADTDISAVATLKFLNKRGSICEFGSLANHINKLSYIGTKLLRSRIHVRPFLELLSKLRQDGAFNNGLELLVMLPRRVQHTESNVFENGAAEQRGLLLHKTHEAAQALDVEIAEVVAVECDGSLGRIIQTRSQAGNGRFSTTREAYKGCVLAGGTLKRDVSQNRAVRPGDVRIGDGVKLDAAGSGRGKLLAIIGARVNEHRRFDILPHLAESGGSGTKHRDVRGNGTKDDAGINQQENDNGDVTDRGAVVLANGLDDLATSLPESKCIGRVGDEVEDASLQGGYKCLFDAVDAGKTHGGGKLGLETRSGVESLHNGNVRQRLLRNGRRRRNGIGHGHGELLRKVAADDGEEQKSRDEGYEHGGQLCILYETNSVGGDEEGRAGNADANLFRGARLDNLHIGIEARRQLAGLALVVKGGVLAQHGAKVGVADAGLETARKDGPAHEVGVDEDEAGDANVDELEDFGVYGALQLVGGGLE
ncbi:hypothetical protein CRV24_009776 [Beauveria bassiana]|nr:hypothetical protein CRV24_009776 [Beauveria bassiana]KAH8708072.1 hypothetical protein HC256_010219 [Beauveria bassiana]